MGHDSARGHVDGARPWGSLGSGREVGVRRHRTLTGNPGTMLCAREAPSTPWQHQQTHHPPHRQSHRPRLHGRRSNPRTRPAPTPSPTRTAQSSPRAGPDSKKASDQQGLTSSQRGVRILVIFYQMAPKFGSWTQPSMHHKGLVSPMSIMAWSVRSRASHRTHPRRYPIPRNGFASAAA